MKQLAILPLLALALIMPMSVFSKEKVSTKADTETQITVDQQCDPNAVYKNHGEYVSCVAKLRLGGQVTSEVARSDIGKKSVSPVPSTSPSPLVSPSPSLSPSPSASPSSSPSPSASPTPSPSASSEVSPSLSPSASPISGPISVTSSTTANLFDLSPLVNLLASIYQSLIG